MFQTSSITINSGDAVGRYTGISVSLYLSKYSYLPSLTCNAAMPYPWKYSILEIYDESSLGNLKRYHRWIYQNVWRAVCLPDLWHQTYMNVCVNLLSWRRVFYFLQSKPSLPENRKRRMIHPKRYYCKTFFL